MRGRTRKVQSSKFKVQRERQKPGASKGSCYPGCWLHGSCLPLGVFSFLRVTVRIATSSRASTMRGSTSLDSTRSVAGRSLSQYKVSCASFRAIENFEALSLRVCAPRASSRLAPIDVPDRITWREMDGGTFDRRISWTYSWTTRQANRNPRSWNGSSWFGMAVAYAGKLCAGPCLSFELRTLNFELCRQ